MPLTLRGVSRELSLPYTTVRKYIMELKRAGVIDVGEGPSGLMIYEKDLEKIAKFVKLVREGYSPRLAISKLEEKDKDLRDIMLEMLEVQNKILERLDEIYKALTYRKKRGFLSRIFRSNP